MVQLVQVPVPYQYLSLKYQYQYLKTALKYRSSTSIQIPYTTTLVPVAQSIE